MDDKEKLGVIKRNTVEIIEEQELAELLGAAGAAKGKTKPVVYCGYEPSGPIHIGHLVTITKLMDFAKAGFKVKVLFADWHAWLNKKGDWDFIEKQVKEWENGFKMVGLDENAGDVEYIVGSSFQRSNEYMDDVLRLSLNITLNRALRSMQQVGRDIENAHVSQIIYPLMQIADMKHLGVDVAYGGIEQRKIHMLAREVMKDIDYKTPICVHTPLISNLTGQEGKMSSSDKEGMISILDDAAAIKQKIKKAYCPEGAKENNPTLEITRLVVFPRIDSFEVKRPEKFGGNASYSSYEELEKDFTEKKLHPMDLKASVSEYLSDIMEKIKK